MVNAQVSNQINRLEKLASSILEMKRRSRPRRPIVIEFCGSPKSGKSSCINALNIFLKRNRFTTRLLAERASICPVNDKFNPLFNIWTTCSAITELSEYLANHSKEIDVIISDRGIFDGLCWFYWMLEHKHITKNDYEHISKFLTMDKWRSIIDLVYVFKADPSVSMVREYATLLTRKHGSVMNDKILKQFLNSIDAVIKEYEDMFRSVRSIDTSIIAQNDVSCKVTDDLLQTLKELIVEKIGYISRESLINKVHKEAWRYSEMPITNQVNFGPRDEIEQEKQFVQPVPIMCIRDDTKESVLVVRKKKESLGPKSPEEGKDLLYVGGHIRLEDNLHGKNEDIMSLSKAALTREVQEELGISLTDVEDDPFCFYIKGKEHSEKHLALCFTYLGDLSQLEMRLDEYEFIQKKGTSKSGRVMQIKSILPENLEEWSKLILEHICGVKMQKQLFNRI